MAEPKLVSVVIPTKNGADTLPSLLEALSRQRTDFDVEIVAIDSGSGDGTQALLQNHEVRLLEIPAREFDHGATRNLGIAHSSGDPICLLTQDATPVGADFLVNLVRPFDQPRIAGVYGRQIPRSDCDVVTRRQLETWLTGRAEPAVADLEGRSLAELPPAERLALCTFDNVCSAVRRSVWQHHPFPRTDFGEDIEWGRTALEAGFAIAYEPSAAVIHSHRRSIRYEYGRTRLCHRRLSELFDVALVPRRRDVLRAMLANWKNDLPFVVTQTTNVRERVAQLFRIAGLSVAAPLGQYHGLRDSRRT